MTLSLPPVGHRSAASTAGRVRRSTRVGGRPRRLLGIAAVCAAALVAAACGGGSDSSSPAASGSASASGTPKVGGTLTLAQFIPPVGLDPVVMTGAGGVTGLIEATAVYDTLMRYDYDTGRYVPGTAESATPNADFTQWTIKIRPGITFSDGTAYDAAAVAYGLNRFRSGAPDAPPCAELIACPSTSTVNIAPFVKDITAVDATTVRVDLKLPWASFPMELATEPGLIPSPTALKKCDGTQPAAQCAFNTAPVGAGPFLVTSFKPGEGITMARNPNYWGGQVPLDGLHFISMNDGGGAKTLDAFNAGTVQEAFLRDPVTVAAAHAAGDKGFSSKKFLGNVLLFNTASPATSDLRVRQAIIAAIDPKVVNERAFQGKGIATSQIFTDQFRWDPGVAGPAYDPDKAATLVAEAKAAGWSGSVRVLASNAPVNTNMGLAVQAMLDKVGIDAKLDNTKDQAGTIGQWAKKDYDTLVFGVNAGNDDQSVWNLASFFLSTSLNNRSGLKDPVLDQAIKDLFGADTDAAKKAAYGKIATELQAQAVVMPLSITDEFIVWTDKVHGVQPDLETNVHLDKAWLG